MTELINKIFNNIWPMVVIFLVAIALFRIFYLKGHRERYCFHKEFSFLVSLLYLWVLFEMLTMTELNSSSGMNLVPFSQILKYKVGTKLFRYNVIGNIVIFIPFGFIFGSYVKPKNILPVLITTILTSTAIEFVQLQIGRSLDVDDIILNVFGGIIGYFIYIGLSAINRHLPDFLKSDWFYNLLCIILLALFLIYFLGYWGAVFK